MYMSLNDLRKKFATDQPFAIQFVKDAEDVGVDIDILDDTGAQVDVITNKNGEVIGGKLYDDVNLLHTYIKVVQKITEESGAIGRPRLADYLHAPFNEPDFSINTNTRIINVPNDFNRNGVGVVGDHLAEILFFTVPRFFDVVDLLDCTNINIYWFNNGLKGDAITYHVSTPVVQYAIGDTLYLGWAISENASVVAGSIEFFIEFEHVNGEGQVDFRLETQSAKVAIKPTLILNKQDVQRDSYNDIIHSRAIYSPIINSLTAAPAQIITNLQEGTFDFTSDGFAVLNVDAISPDNGRLVYHWNWNGIMVDQPDGNLINSDTLSDAITYELVDNKNVSFSHAAEIDNYEPITPDGNPSALGLYVKDDNDNYVLTTDIEVDENTAYYRGVPKIGTTYKTLKTNVPGTYQVYIGNENNEGGIRYVYSATTIIDPVSKIVIDNSQLPGLAYLDWDSSVLSVSVPSYNGEISYQWYHEVEGAEDELIVGATNATYDPSNNNMVIEDVSKRGYYYCIATNTKNNTREHAVSNKVMIESKPIALNENEISLTHDGDQFTITIQEPQTNMHYQMYANVIAQVPTSSGKYESKTYEVKDASKVFSGGTASFSIAGLNQMYTDQNYEIDVYLVPVAQYGTVYQRYAERVENGVSLPAYVRVYMDGLTK